MHSPDGNDGGGAVTGARAVVEDHQASPLITGCVPITTTPEFSTVARGNNLNWLVVLDPLPNAAGNLVITGIPTGAFSKIPPSVPFAANTKTVTVATTISATTKEPSVAIRAAFGGGSATGSVTIQ